jgi:hypothetical protein
MTARFAEKRLRTRKTLTLALAVAAALGAGAARAQQNPVRALTNAMGMTKDTGDGPDFVRETRPDLKSLDFSHLTGVDKPRVPVKTPAELEADKAQLIADRERADARRKKLQAEKVEAIAPNKAPPVQNE